MAKQQFIVGANIRLDGKHTPKSTVLTLDIDGRNATDAERYNLLVLSGRLIPFSEKALKEIKAEAAAEDQAIKDAMEEEKAIRAWQRKQRMSALQAA